MGNVEGVGEIATLLNLSQYRSLKKDKTSLIFRRAYIPSIGNEPPLEYLQIVPRNTLTLWQSILRFFGHSNYKYETVKRLISEAQRKYSDFKPTMIEYDNIVSAIHHVNKEMSRVRGSKILGIFQRTVPSDVSVTVPSLADIKPESSNGKPKSLPTPPLQPKPEPLFTNPPPYARPPGAIKGLVNPLCFCYYNSSLKLLWTSAGLRQMVERSHTPAAALLRNLFTELEKGGDALAHEEELPLYSEESSPLKGLDRFLFERATSPEMIFSKLADVEAQQDAEEFMSALLAEVLELQISPTTSKPLVTLQREKVRRDKITDSEQLEEARKQSRPPLAAMRLGIVDSSEQLRSTVVKMNIVGEKPSIQRFFNGTRYHETVYADAVIGDDENKKWLTSKQKKALRDAEASSPTQSLGTVEVEEKYVLARGVPPSFLPIQVARFRSVPQHAADGTIMRDEAGRPIALLEKDFTPVEAPFLLSVPVEGGGTEQYVLRGIDVHRDGASIHSGHYVTYIPDPTAPLDKEGRPTKWFQHSDTHITRMDSNNAELKHDIEDQGYLFLYDHISFHQGKPAALK